MWSSNINLLPVIVIFLLKFEKKKKRLILIGLSYTVQIKQIVQKMYFLMDSLFSTN